MTKSDDAHTRPKNPLPPPPQLPPIRSKQATLVMGGNVNEPVGALPPPPTLPPHLTEGHSSQPSTPPPAAPQGPPSILRLPPLPPPPVIPTSTPPMGGLPAPTPLPLPRGPLPRASSPHVSETKTMPPTALSRASLSGGVAAGDFGSKSVEWAKAQVTRTKAQATRVQAWLDADKRRWFVPGAVGVLLFGGVGYCSAPGSESPVAVTNGSIREQAPSSGGAEVRGVEPTNEEGESNEREEASSVKSKQAKSKPALDVAALPVADALPSPKLEVPTTGDPRFVVRERVSSTSCDEAMGKPFEVNPERNSGEAGARWNRSRKSLMLGRKEQALKEMCESASWDVEGRATFGLSEFYFRESDFQEALTWAKRVPSGSRRYVDAQAMVGDVYNQIGDVKAARTAYLEAWNMASDDARTLERTAANFALSAHRALRKKDWWTAENFFRRALVLNEKDSMAALGLARVFLRFEFNEASVLWAEHALAVGADSDEALLAMCEAHYANKDKAGAQKALDRLKEIAPSDPNLAVWAARIEEL